MRDPHVETLRYKLETGQEISYDSPPPVEVSTDTFEGSLSNGVLICHMKHHYPSVEVARKDVEEFLRSWEIDAALARGRNEVRFVYEDAKVIDRDPSHSGRVHEVGIVLTGHSIISGSVKLHVTRKTYPGPPKTFRTSPDVETLWQRYQNYLDEKEPLPSMAYFCLTVLESLAGGRSTASKLFGIDSSVLNRLGLLTSTRGDHKTARKAEGVLNPISGKERAWIESAIKKIIYRVGEYKSGEQLKKITMADLPLL